MIQFAEMLRMNGEEFEIRRSGQSFGSAKGWRHLRTAKFIFFPCGTDVREGDIAFSRLFRESYEIEEVGLVAEMPLFGIQEPVLRAFHHPLLAPTVTDGSRPRLSHPSSLVAGYGMDIVLSWSGSQTHEFAKFLQGWLKDVIPGVQPWISSRNIGKGFVWLDALHAKLRSAQVLIACVTPESINAPWVHYEVGFFAAIHEQPIVSPFLIAVEAEEANQTPTVDPIV